jgi:hypothetical protein
MAFLDEITTYFGTLGLTGYTITAGQRPDGTDKVVTVYETGGFPAELGFGVAGIQFEHPTVQVTVRGEADDYAGPRAILQTIYKEFPKQQAATLSGTKYNTVRPTQAPFLLERDAKRRVVLAVNFEIEKAPS